MLIKKETTKKISTETFPDFFKEYMHGVVEIFEFIILKMP